MTVYLIDADVMRQYIKSHEEPVSFEWRNTFERIQANATFTGDCFELPKSFLSTGRTGRYGVVSVMNLDGKYSSTTLSRLVYSAYNFGKASPNHKVTHMCGNTRCVTSNHVDYALLREIDFCEYCGVDTDQSIMLKTVGDGRIDLHRVCSHPHSVNSGGTGLSSHQVSDIETLKELLGE